MSIANGTFFSQNLHTHVGLTQQMYTCGPFFGIYFQTIQSMITFLSTKVSNFAIKNFQSNAHQVKF